MGKKRAFYDAKRAKNELLYMQTKCCKNVEKYWTYLHHPPYHGFWGIFFRYDKCSQYIKYSKKRRYGLDFFKKNKLYERYYDNKIIY